MAVDEEPVEGGVDEVGGDEREGDGAAVVSGLQVAAQSEVDEQREDAPVEAAQGGDGEGEDPAVDGEVREDQRREREEADEQNAERSGECQAVKEPAVGGRDIVRAEGLGDEGVEA